MELDNSVYTITPPSLYLNENGPSILVMGFVDDMQVKQISEVYDAMFPNNSISYYYDSKNINDATVSWARAVSGMVDFIICNVDTINTLETMIAMNAIDNGRTVPVLWISEENKNPALNKLLISYGYKLFYNLADMEQMIMLELESKSA